MKRIKKTAAGWLLSGATLVMACTASAQGFTVGGAPNGSSTFSGVVLVHGTIPCNTTFAVTVSSCVAKIVGATFGGSAACAAVRANLPWSLSVISPINPSGPDDVQANGVSVFVPAPYNQTCIGNVPGVLSSSGVLTFNAVLSPACPFATTSSGLVSSPPLTAAGPPTC